MTSIDEAREKRKRRSPPPSYGDWRDALLYAETPNGGRVLLKHLANAVSILRHDDSWSGVVAYDEFSSRIVKVRPPPWHPHDAPAHEALGPWTDEDAARTASWLARKWSLRVGTAVTTEAAAVVAQGNAFHPVRDYLDKLRWDGTQRIDRWLETYFGAEASEYVRRVGRWWLISAIARVLKPGCKVDHVLIAEGGQGAFKSSAVAALASPGWFTDELGDIGTKDCAQGLQGKWIIEIGELEAMGRAEVTRAKWFFSKAEDRFRPSYGRGVKDFPRQCVFFGTTNSSQYLRDDTGNRRYWPFRVGAVDLEGIRRDRDQLWAEALEAYRGGARWWPEGTDEHADCRVEQDERFQADEWEQKIGAWVQGRLETTVGDVLSTALNIEAGKWSKADQMRASSALKRLGWERMQISVIGRRQWVYRPKASPTTAPTSPT